MLKKAKVIIIAGATATGKTAVAVEVARRLGSEVISADSMQVYRCLSIGTAKPRPDEYQEIPYRLIDYVDPWEQYHAGRFLEDARPLVENLNQAGRIPIVSGGTGMYIRALLYGMFESPPRDLEIRASLDRQLADNGLPAVYDELMNVDPDSARFITPNDRQRILRALEVYRMTGIPLTKMQTHSTENPLYDAMEIVLHVERSALRHRINTRVDRMVEAGLVDEVKTYLAAGHSVQNPAILALGYREIIACLHDDLSNLPSAFETMKSKSRQYAKRQETWFRSMNNSIRIDVTHANLIRAVDEVMANIEKHDWES